MAFERFEARSNGAACSGRFTHYRRSRHQRGGREMLRKTHPALVHPRSVPAPTIERRIYLIRGQKVMFDRDLAELCEVPTHRLNEAVRRNRDRFPDDFMFQLSGDETRDWRSQSAISNPAVRMSLRYRPLVFTEHGVAMLSSVLRRRKQIRFR